MFLFSHETISQEIDPNFLNTIPDNIKKDIVNIQSEQFEALDNKEYDAFDSKINKKDELSVDNSSLERFGDKFFNTTASTFMPINDPASNSGYILDVDDEILIQFFGDRSEQYKYKINRSGDIFLKDIGKVSLAGLSLATANDLISQLAIDNFIETEVFVTIEKIRDIEVLVTGHVNSPGIYILNGYSNVLHALIMAGGISEFGSFRNVIVKRPGLPDKSIDLYDFFIFADTLSNISLRSGYSIFVDSTTNLVPIRGGVAREAIYEFKDKETSADLIKFAGGKTLNSFSKKPILSRFSDGKLNSYELNDPIELNKNDRLFIPFNEFDPDNLIIDSENYFITEPISINGAIKRPGNYFMQQGDTLLSLLEKVGGYTDDAYPFGGILISKEAATLESQYNERLYNEAVKSIASLTNASKSNDLMALMTILSNFKQIETSGRVVAEFKIENIQEDPSLDTVLNPGDSIFIPYKKDRVYVFGEVLNSGTLKYFEDLKLVDYIEAAGGLSKYAENSSIIIVNANGKVDRATIKKFGNNYDYIKPGTVIYVPRNLSFVEGTELAKVIAPIFSSLAISLASLNSISNN